jgi:phosphodiesterase/alkaline phosphatase D-like protein
MYGSEFYNATRDGPWEDIVTAAVRAYNEYLPTRYLMDDGAYIKSWSTFQFGDLATLVMMEISISATWKTSSPAVTPPTGRPS